MADFISYSAGPDGWRHAAACAGDHAGELSEREAWPGDGSIRSRYHPGADSWPDARRIHHRSLQLALDLLLERAGRGLLLPDDAQIRVGSPVHKTAGGWCGF